MRLRSVISRTTHITCGPSLVSSGLSVISTGNSLPSARRPTGPDRIPWAASRASPGNARGTPGADSRKRLGHQFVDGLARKLFQPAAEHFPRQRIRQHNACPARSTCRMASGEASKIWRNRRSACTTSRAPGSRRRSLQLQDLLGGNRQPEKFAGMQAVRGAFQDAIHHQARVGLLGQDDQGNRFGASAQGFQGGAPTPAGSCIFRHHQVVLGSIEDRRHFFRASAVACPASKPTRANSRMQCSTISGWVLRNSTRRADPHLSNSIQFPATVY